MARRPAMPATARFTRKPLRRASRRTMERHDMSKVDLPDPQDLADRHARAAYAGMCTLAGAYGTAGAVDPASAFLADVCEALSKWVLADLDRRGLPRATFDD